MAMTRVVAVKTFFSQNTNRPLENKEMMDFWKSLSDAEKTEYSDAAAKALGETIALA